MEVGWGRGNGLGCRMDKGAGVKSDVRNYSSCPGKKEWLGVTVPAVKRN